MSSLPVLLFALFVAPKNGASLKNASNLFKHGRGINLNKKGGEGSPSKKSIPGSVDKQAKASNYAKKGVKAVANKAVDAGIDKAGQAAAGVTGGTSIIAAEIIKRHKKETLYLILIILVATLLPLLFIVFLLVGDQQALQQQQGQGQNVPITSDVCTPSTVPNGYHGTSVCTITVSYSGSATDIVITSTILPGTTYVSAGQGGTYDQTTNTVTWDAKKSKLQLNPVNFSVTVTVRVTTTKTNVKVWNAYSINPTGLQVGSGSTGGNVQPNNNTCNGKYVLTNPLKNFGDPQCNFTAQGLGAKLNTLDPTRKYTWDCIARYESTGGSGYNPNAYNPSSTSGNGAYGLFQMNPPGKGNNQYDNGGVNWSVQTSNAINYNKGLGGSFAYWGTYYTNGGPCH